MNPLASLSRAIRASAVASTLLLFVVSISMALLMGWAMRNSLLDRAQRDLVIAAATPAEEQDPDIVVVAVDDDFIDHFSQSARYRDPVDRHEIARLLQTIAEKHPRAIGLDLVLDHYTEPAKDEELRKELGQLSNTFESHTSVVVAQKADETPSEREVLKNFMFDGNARAVRDFCVDDSSGTVKAALESVPDPDGGAMHSFANALSGGDPVAQAQSTESLGCAGHAPGTSALEIAWHGVEPWNQHYFREYPARFIDQLPADWFAGKIVLIGMNVQGIDRQRTPFTGLLHDREGGVPDVVVQAHAISQLLRHRPPPSVAPNIDFVVAFLLAFLGAAMGAGTMSLGLRAGIGVFAIAATWIVGIALYYFGGVLVGLVAPTLAGIASFVATETLSGSAARRQRASIQRAFASYVPPKLVDRLARDPERLSLDGEVRTMSFIFTDVKDFTAMAESLKDDPAKLPPILNAYLDGIARIVVDHDGMIDKFIGDAVFAIFNAPIDLADFAEKAVHCALAIDDFGERFRKEQEARGVAFGLTRIGVHTGSAIIGNFGGRARFTYTAAGDAVNTAARLESLNKRLGTRICASGETRERCKIALFRPVATAAVKGKSQYVEIWQPLHDGEYTPDYLRRYEDAVALMKQGSAGAASAFAALQAEDPNDPLVRMYVERTRAGLSGTVIGLTD